MELTATTNRPSDLFNLSVIAGTELEKMLACASSLAAVMAEPETVFWKPQPSSNSPLWRRS